MQKISSFRDYFIASLIGAVVFVFLAWYQMLRRGFFFHAPGNAGFWYVPNQALAEVSVILIGLSFLVGPVSRYFDRFDTWLQYRKEIGIIGGAIGILHGLLTAFFIPGKFSLPWLFAVPLTRFTATAGLLGTVVLTFLIIISLQYFIDKLGGVRWWFLQRWGIRLAILFTLLHVLPMQWKLWKVWLMTGGAVTREIALPHLAPLSLLVALPLLWITLLRFYEGVFLYKSWGVTTREISVDPYLKARGRRFFLISLWIMLAIEILLATWWLW